MNTILSYFLKCGTTQHDRYRSSDIGVASPMLGPQNAEIEPGTTALLEISVYLHGNVHNLVPSYTYPWALVDYTLSLKVDVELFSLF